jgi:D-3-phosphoglycerate dehydrogenase / 2-oxoglutarate reductase
MIILANDGIDNAGKSALEASGFTVLTDHIPQDQLAAAINTKGITGLLVRSATTVRKDLIDACPGLRFVGRGGVGIDNIDAEYARSKGIEVFNTPASSSRSVAELVIALMFASVRSVYQAGNKMPAEGSTAFAALKKSYSKGTEIAGKTLGIIGFGRIGQALASYALGCGMNVLVSDPSRKASHVSVHLSGLGEVKVPVNYAEFDTILSSSDFISLHVPKQPNGAAVLGSEELKKVKKGVVLINTSRGGVIEEKALIAALDSGHVGAACLDVFVNEPTPDASLLSHPKVIATPHIGASTAEAQERIGLEIAENVRRIMGVTA